MGFGAWRHQIRLARAVDLIGRGGLMGDVADQLGYVSQSAFSAMFKRTFGVPPSQFVDAKDKRLRQGMTRKLQEDLRS